MRAHRQAQSFTRYRFCYRKTACSELHFRISLLHVRRHRVVNQGADAGGGKSGLQRVALRVTDNKLVPNRFNVRSYKGQKQICFA